MYAKYVPQNIVITILCRLIIRRYIIYISWVSFLIVLYIEMLLVLLNSYIITYLGSTADIISQIESVVRSTTPPIEIINGHLNICEYSSSVSLSSVCW